MAEVHAARIDGDLHHIPDNCLAEGGLWSGEQCPDCGGPWDEDGDTPCDWEIVKRAGKLAVKCTCGTTIPIRQHPESEVIF